MARLPPPPDPRVCGGVLCSEKVNISTPEPTAAEPVQEPTPELMNNDVKCGIGTQKIDGICYVIQTQEPQNIFTKFYDWIYSIFE